MGKYTAARDLDLSTKARWYLVANRSDAVIYREKDQQFHFVDRITNDDGKRTETELDSDRPGRSGSSNGNGGHALDRHSVKHENVAKTFAARIAKTLDEAKRGDRYSELVVAAEPHFLGLLMAAFPAAVKGVIVQSIKHEYARGSDAEIRAKIYKALERE